MPLGQVLVYVVVPQRLSRLMLLGRQDDTEHPWLRRLTVDLRAQDAGDQLHVELSTSNHARLNGACTLRLDVQPGLDNYLACIGVTGSRVEQA